MNQRTQIGLNIVAAVYCLSVGCAAMAGETEQFLEATEALTIEDAGTAYGTFIKIFTVIDPHPDRELQRFIVRASEGDVDSFALLCMFVWQGHGGIIQDKLSGKFGLIRAKNDGSADAAYYIAQTFFQSAGDTDDEKLDNAIAGLQWLGISAAMGNEESHDAAMKYIRESAKGNAEITQALVDYYNSGLAQGRSDD